MANVVLVVDMVVGFLEPGRNLYCGDEARRIIPNVKRLIDEERSKGSEVLFICDTHDPDDLEFQMFPVHCIRGTDETDVIPELAGDPGDRIQKRRYSAFFETDLEQRLAASDLTRSSSVACAQTSASCIRPQTCAIGITSSRCRPTAWPRSTLRRTGMRSSTWRRSWGQSSWA